MKIKTIICKIVWKICGIHWRVGNFVMDLLGYERYVNVMEKKNGA